MNDALHTLIRRAESGGFFESLEALFQQMDAAYEAAASHYGFACTGCEDNCCLTRFHHHTHIEYLYLISGFERLEADRQRQCIEAAVAYDREMVAAEAREGRFRHMCPLNGEGLCELYAHRPMICRLHGVPHEINPPGRGRLLSAGCTEFDRRCGDRPYHRLDRTPLYIGMSELEQQLKKALGVNRKFKRTVAQMLIASGDELR